MTRVIVVASDIHNPHILLPAAEALRMGQLVAFPTETVYGLGADALNPEAVAKIFVAKGRPATDPLIVHVGSIGQVAMIADLSDATLAERVKLLGTHFWPGPLTLVLPKQPHIPANVTAGLASVGVRVPAHPVAQTLLKQSRVPIAAPSANRFSHPSPTQAQHVYTDLAGRIDWLVDGGPTSIGIESTVLDMTQSPPTVLRPGGITLESLQMLLPDITYVPRIVHAATAAAAPGMNLKHYAPTTPLFLIEGPLQTVIATAQRELERRRDQRVGLLAPDQAATALDDPRLTIFALGQTPDQIAARLYAGIRDSDTLGLDVVLALHVVGDGVLIAVRDRLFRAAEGKRIQ